MADVETEKSIDLSADELAQITELRKSPDLAKLYWACAPHGPDKNELAFEIWEWLRDSVSKTDALEHEKEAGQFWSGLWRDTPTTDEIKRELTDYHMILTEVSKVYCHVTGNRISKENSRASAVISEADQRISEIVDEHLAEQKEAHDAETESLRGQVAALKAALKPFADEAGEWDDADEKLSDKYMPLIGHEQDTNMAKATFCLGDLRHARQLVGED